MSENIHEEKIEQESTSAKHNEEEKNTVTVDKNLPPAREDAPNEDAIPSTCRALRQLADHLEESKSPLFHPDQVLVPRAETLELIRGLAELCMEETLGDPSEDDELLDSLAATRSQGRFRPLELVRNRAATIMREASERADATIKDAQTLSSKLIQDTEEKIKERYDELDRDIAARMDLTREESSKRLSEARQALTQARQEAVEILEAHRERAEHDYEGYWERAERTVLVSYERSASILSVACELYERELNVIRKDLEELNTILHDLKLKRPV